ncbi:metalloprotease [Thelephora ganbajun]|uniref:Metalloprotease n=1 Tax=Thelephora ganbajun TaxID=370292 RepID=A0ACB6ZDQ0_THEGA|nr:metalloprotease [Thelephora ganbajun]
MKVLSLGSSLVAASPVSSWSNTTAHLTRACGTTPSEQFISQAEAHFAENKVVVDSEVGIAIASIPVYWHVIYKSTSLSEGYIPDSQISSSISVLNADYARCGISFHLAGIDRTHNVNWFDQVGPGSSYQTAMKNKLRKGGANDLNVYSVGFNSGSGAGLLGYTTFPWSYARAPRDDGVVILHSSVPGGTAAPYNEGKSLTHETGHWVGLYHTFQGGCKPPGDYVADTAPEARPVFGCPASSFSCPGGEPDPYHNYMDYSDDSCMNNFTPGQCARLKAQIATYRRIV